MRLGLCKRAEYDFSPANLRCIDWNDLLGYRWNGRRWKSHYNVGVDCGACTYLDCARGA